MTPEDEPKLGPLPVFAVVAFGVLVMLALVVASALLLSAGA